MTIKPFEYDRIRLEKQLNRQVLKDVPALKSRLNKFDGNIDEFREYLKSFSEIVDIFLEFLMELEPKITSLESRLDDYTKALESIESIVTRIEEKLTGDL